MFTLKIDGQTYTKDTLAECSNIYCRIRDELGLGASDFPPVPIRRHPHREPLGYVAYNGRIFAGKPRAWTPTTQVLYDNR